MMPWSTPTGKKFIVFTFGWMIFCLSALVLILHFERNQAEHDDTIEVLVRMAEERRVETREMVGRNYNMLYRAIEKMSGIEEKLDNIDQKLGVPK